MSTWTNNRWLAALVGGALCAAAPPLADAHPTAGRPQSASAAKHGLTKKERRRIRRQLERQLKRDPATVFKRSFMKKADLVDFKLPLTIRFGPSVSHTVAGDNQVEITWTDSVDPWPLAGTTLAAPQTVDLTSGIFTMQADFGGDASGSGELGAVETMQGGLTDIRAESFDIAAAQPGCVDGSNQPFPPRLRAFRDPSISATTPAIKFTNGGTRTGLLNMFAGKVRGSIMLSTTIVTEASDDSCTPLAETSVPTTPAPPMPLRYNGDFHVSPALTSDGKMRLGRMTIDDASLPQDETYVLFAGCTTVGICNEQRFPAHLKLKKLKADVLLGDIRSS